MEMLQLVFMDRNYLSSKAMMQQRNGGRSKAVIMMSRCGEVQLNSRKIKKYGLKTMKWDLLILRWILDQQILSRLNSFRSQQKMRLHLRYRLWIIGLHKVMKLEILNLLRDTNADKSGLNRKDSIDVEVMIDILIKLSKMPQLMSRH